MHTGQCVCRPALHIIHSGTPETELQIDDKVGSRRAGRHDQAGI
jgi:hypothetical protein